MKLNEAVALIGQKLIFVPYKKHHVEKYHQWMKSEELLEKTASEPLSLEEEYEMQHKWCEDDDKCTFILLSQSLIDKHMLNNHEKEINAMVGDVNLFCNNPENKNEAELEIMIAEQSMRGRGFGKEAALVMMYYGVHFLDIQKYTVKIGFDNTPSIHLFEKLGFQEESRSEVFQEITYRMFCKSDDFIINVMKIVETFFHKTLY